MFRALILANPSPYARLILFNLDQIEVSQISNLGNLKLINFYFDKIFFHYMRQKTQAYQGYVEAF